MDDDAFASIKAGLEEAIAFQRGELEKPVRLTRFERLPDGTLRRIVEEVTSPPTPTPGLPSR